MASREPIELVFGAEKFKIKPLTIGQVERIEKALISTDMQLGGAEIAHKVVKIAMSRDHAAVDVAELECDTQALAVALANVLRLGGFVPAKPGELSAAAGNSASTGGETSEAV